MHVPAKLNQEPIPEGMRIEFKGGAHIHFTTTFKYLGSKLSDNLDVKTCIAIANSQVGQLKEFLRCKDIPRMTKKFLYQAIPLITLLWGCEPWALKEEKKRMLDAFHHGVI
jgi:hypothetical protein